MQDRELWLNARRQGLGGSDVAAVLGLSKWRGPMDVWADKKKLSPDQDENYAMMRGRILESAVANWYAEKTGAVLEEGPPMPIKGPEPWMLGSPDRYATTEEDGRYGVEIKTARSSDDWGPDGSSLIPVYYATQVAWYMACTNIDRWDVAVLFMLNDEFRHYTIHRDPIVEKKLVGSCRNWWNQYILSDNIPPIDESDAAAQHLQQKYPTPSQELRKASPDETNLVFDLYDVNEEIKLLKQRKARLENQIKDLIGDDEGLWNDWGKVTWKLNKGRATIDTKRLREEEPEIATKFTRTSEPSRVFRQTITGR